MPTGLLSVATVLLILWLTLAPKPLGNESLSLFPGADKIAHALMFGFLTFTILLDLQRKTDWNKISVVLILISATFSSIFGISTELLQDAMHLGRGKELGDMIADTSGSYLIALLWVLFQHYWTKS